MENDQLTEIDGNLIPVSLAHEAKNVADAALQDHFARRVQVDVHFSLGVFASNDFFFLVSAWLRIVNCMFGRWEGRRLYRSIFTADWAKTVRCRLRFNLECTSIDAMQAHVMTIAATDRHGTS